MKKLVATALFLPFLSSCIAQEGYYHPHYDSAPPPPPPFIEKHPSEQTRIRPQSPIVHHSQHGVQPHQHPSKIYRHQTSRGTAVIVQSPRSGVVVSNDKEVRRDLKNSSTTTMHPENK